MYENRYLGDEKSLVAEIKAYWKIWRRQLYLEAQKENQLDEMALSLAKSTLSLCQTLEEKCDLDPIQAASEAKREYILVLDR